MRCEKGKGEENSKGGEKKKDLRKKVLAERHSGRTSTL